MPGTGTVRVRRVAPCPSGFVKRRVSPLVACDFYVWISLGSVHAHTHVHVHVCGHKYVNPQR